MKIYVDKVLSEIIYFPEYTYLRKHGYSYISVTKTMSRQR